MLFAGSKTPLYDKGVKLTYLITLKTNTMNTNPLSKEERKLIKKQFSYGDMQKIADRLDLCASSVYQYFNGTTNNPEILIESLKIINEYEVSREKARNFILKYKNLSTKS